MGKIKKIFLWTGVTLITLLIILGVAIKIIVTKEFVAEQIENSINGRVEIGDITVPLWVAMSGITIDDFKIGYKDGEMKKPMEERSPMKSEVIGFKSFVFKVAIGKLITSRGDDFELKSLVMIEPKANIVLFKEGGNNLSQVLIKKRTVSEIKEEREEAAQEKKEAELARKKSAKSKKVKKEKSKPFSIKSIATVIKMGKIGMENGHFTVNIQKLGNTLTLSNVDFLLKDVYIDPANLDKPGKNTVKLETGLTMKLDENKKSKAVQSFLFKFSTNGTITPFDSKTGRVTQTAAVHSVIHQGTYFTGLAVMKNFKSKTDQLKKIGVNLDFIGDKFELSKNSEADILYTSGKITFTSDLVFYTSGMDVKLSKNSWLSINTYKHKFTGDIVLSKSHTATVEKQVDQAVGPAIKAVVSALPASVRGKANTDPVKLRNELLSDARDPEGRVKLGYKSSGDLTSPSVAITKPSFASPKDLASKALGDVTKGVKAAINAEVDKQKARLKKEADAKIAAEKKKAEDAAKKKAAKALKDKVKIPGF